LNIGMNIEDDGSPGGEERALAATRLLLNGGYHGDE
jgi:hypothetical protein